MYIVLILTLCYNIYMSFEQLTRRMRDANMIRERSVHEYEKDLGIDVVDLAVQGLMRNRKFTWYDMCCGDFNAGRDVSYATEGRALCVGVDVDTLLDDPSHEIAKNCRIELGDVTTYPLPENVDLITCNKGLRYIDQYYGRAVMLDTVRNWRDALPAGGRLIAEATDEASWYRMPDYLIESFDSENLRWSNGCQVIDITT